MGIEYSKDNKYTALEVEIERKSDVIDSYQTMITEQNKIIDQLKEEVMILKDKINKITNFVEAIKNEKNIEMLHHNNNDSIIKNRLPEDNYEGIQYENIENEIFLIEYPSSCEDNLDKKIE